ncbi:hypothetical protein BJ875DRAFT_239134 [Amylocarpus encephaloides]|uniref:Uncharacterized protein n=1 Tax=Amylocarpus encephaloides TaxID=45428 RepID=A0A9P7YLX8_9HELO|nr:hypothetical protein BJ875DRAFT_239134 [Amylocarpus encephaloides]
MMALLEILHCLFSSQISSVSLPPNPVPKCRKDKPGSAVPRAKRALTAGQLIALPITALRVAIAGNPLTTALRIEAKRPVPLPLPAAPFVNSWSSSLPAAEVVVMCTRGWRASFWGLLWHRHGSVVRDSEEPISGDGTWRDLACP